MTITAAMVLARDAGDGFGQDDGSLPWTRIGWDMRHFRKATSGRVMIMGRKTYMGCAADIELGMDRELIVMTRNPRIYNWSAEEPGNHLVTGWEQLVETVRETGKDPIFCGGAELFESVLRGEGAAFFHIQTAWVTQLHIDSDADMKYEERFSDFRETASRHMQDQYGAGTIVKLERDGESPP